MIKQLIDYAIPLVGYVIMYAVARQTGNPSELLLSFILYMLVRADYRNKDK